MGNHAPRGLRAWPKALLNERVPFAAVGALAEPLARLIAAILADKYSCGLFCHPNEVSEYRRGKRLAKSNKGRNRPQVAPKNRISGEIVLLMTVVSGY